MKSKRFLSPETKIELLLIELLCVALEDLLGHAGCSPETPCSDCGRARQALKIANER